MSKFQAETFQLLLKQRGSITQQNHLCRGRLKRFPAWSFLAGVTHAVGSSQNLQPSNGSTASSLTTSNREPRLSTLIRPTRASGASISRLGQVSSNQQGPHEAIPIISPDHFFVLFGIEGTRKSLELAQIDVKEYKNDSTFFNKLLLEYQPRRGFLRYWFSVWRLSHCDFVKACSMSSHSSYPYMLTTHSSKRSDRIESYLEVKTCPPTQATNILRDHRMQKSHQSVPTNSTWPFLPAVLAAYSLYSTTASSHQLEPSQ